MKNLMIADEGVQVLVLAKGDERFVFMYADGQESELITRFSRFASDPELSFNWNDAVNLSLRVRAG